MSKSLRISSDEIMSLIKKEYGISNVKYVKNYEDGDLGCVNFNYVEGDVNDS